MSRSSPDEVFTELPYGLNGRLFRSPMPFSGYDRHGELVEQYRKAGVVNIVLLAEHSECLNIAGRDLKAYYQEQGFNVLHLPVPDFGVPSLPALSRVVDLVLAGLDAGQNTAVHCHAGVGRTGLFAACLARRSLGLMGNEAVEWVRKFLPGAVEVPAQIRLVKEFK